MKTQKKKYLYTVEINNNNLTIDVVIIPDEDFVFINLYSHNETLSKPIGSLTLSFKDYKSNYCFETLDPKEYSLLKHMLDSKCIRSESDVVHDTLNHIS